MPDDVHEPEINWQEECMKARQVSECYRQLYMEAMANLADMRVSFSMMQRNTNKQGGDDAQFPRS
jgi:hypothetical protein